MMEPLLPPLRVSKVPRHIRSQPKSPLGCGGPPYAIPRRSSSFAIRAKNISTSNTTKPKLAGENDAERSREEEVLDSKGDFRSEQRDSFTGSSSAGYMVLCGLGYYTVLD